MKVTFTFSSGQTKVTNVNRQHLEGTEALLTRAAQKLWGARAFFVLSESSGGVNYGRVAMWPTRHEERKGYSSSILYGNLSVTMER